MADISVYFLLECPLCLRPPMLTTLVERSLTVVGSMMLRFDAYPRQTPHAQLQHVYLRFLASLSTISGSRLNRDFCVGFHPNSFLTLIALALEFIPQKYEPRDTSLSAFSGVTFSISAVGMRFFLCASFAMALAISPQTKSPFSAK